MIVYLPTCHLHVIPLRPMDAMGNYTSWEPTHPGYEFRAHQDDMKRL